MFELLLKNGRKIYLKRAIEDSELLIINKLAYIIWPEVYESVLPKEQINLLLSKYFEIDKLKKFILDGYEYYLLSQETINFGFVSFVDKGDFLYIDKLYLIKEYRHQGIGKLIFKNLLNFYKKPLKLNVNQKNMNAINAYLNSGFEIEKEEYIKLNDSLTNIDFVMILKKSEESHI